MIYGIEAEANRVKGLAGFQFEGKSQAWSSASLLRVPRRANVDTVAQLLTRRGSPDGQPPGKKTAMAKKVGG
jgi:hypothetical protein